MGTLLLACTATALTTDHFFFSLCCLPICNNILYCFPNHKQHCGGKQFLPSYLFQYDRRKKEWGVGGKNRKETACLCLHSLMLLFQSTLAPLSGLFYGIMGPLNFHTICNVLGRTKIFILLKKVSMGVQSVIYLIILSIDSGYRFKRPKCSYLTRFFSGNPACFHLKYGEERSIIISLMSF